MVSIDVYLCHVQLCVSLIFPQKKPGLCIVLYEGIPYFLVYELTPVFQAKNNNIFESLTCISGPPMIDDTKQNKIEGIKDKKQ